MDSENEANALGRRIKLLKKHYEEWKNNLSEERKCREALALEHSRELSQATNEIHKAELLTRYSQKLISLQQSFERERTLMKANHKDELNQLDSEFNINSDRDN